jgi:hypothetical protein
MKKWEIIREAKKYLTENRKDECKNNKTEFVCFAIERVIEASQEDVIEIRRFINKLLCGERAFGNWILKYGGISRKQYYEDYDRGFPKMQAARLAWMNWMQEHYKSLDQ